MAFSRKILIGAAVLLPLLSTLCAWPQASQRPARHTREKQRVERLSAADWMSRYKQIVATSIMSSDEELFLSQALRNASVCPLQPLPRESTGVLLRSLAERFSCGQRRLAALPEVRETQELQRDMCVYFASVSDLCSDTSRDLDDISFIGPTGDHPVLSLLLQRIAILQRMRKHCDDRENAISALCLRQSAYRQTASAPGGIR